MKLATDRFKKIMPANPQGAFEVAMADLKRRKDAAMKTYNDSVEHYQKEMRANNEVRWYRKSIVVYLSHCPRNPPGGRLHGRVINHRLRFYSVRWLCSFGH